VFDFVWNFVLPVGIFIYCYARIFQLIRRHNRIRSNGIPMVDAVIMATIIVGLETIGQS